MNKQGSAAPYLLIPQESNTDASYTPLGRMPLPTLQVLAIP